ncbi:MAG: hypothetical protein V7L00_20540 [Nostoc sp.]|uniref:hypothetical protein n=1 Tax=Nostoc sp. TaxID=1180 RepID=UPI002FFB0304
MTGWCISGKAVTAKDTASPIAIYYATEPQITYHSNSVDQAYWGFAYTSFNNATSFVDGSYTIFQSDEASCQHIDNDKYDCINGNCVVSSQYKTPGIYTGLATCQAVCANGGACAAGKQCVDPTTFCPDGKVCIEQAEFASVEGLISKINSEVC